MDYEKGQFVRRRFTQKRMMTGDKTVATIEVGAADGPWRPASRDLDITVPWAGAPSRVLIGGDPLARVTPDELRRQPRGWTQDADGAFVTVKLPDRFEAVRITIEGLRQ
jgi:hypothetical protein